MNFRIYFLAAYVISCMLFSACRKDEPLYPSGSNEAVNTWIWREMGRYYYWQNLLKEPVDFRGDPIDFFNNILVEEDRFSAIVQSQSTETYNSSLTNTFGFDLIAIERYGQEFHILSHVVPQSTGHQLGLVRGDTVYAINGEPVRISTIASLIQQALTKKEIELTLSHQRRFRIPAAYVAQPVVYTHRVFETSEKVGYLYLSHFDFSGAYPLLSAVAELKAANIRDLVLDLRYNPGGEVSFAAFCSLLLTDVRPDDVFVAYRGNKIVADLDERFSDALARQPDGYYFSVPTLQSASLKMKRLYVLTSKHTASAAELLINNLRPYLTIVHIGDTTFGKDMASTTRTTPVDVIGSQQNWHIQPLVYKLFNVDESGNYTMGITPDHLVFEHQSLPLYPFGDRRDPLVAKALALLSDNTSSVQVPSSFVSPKRSATVVLYESLPYTAKPIRIDTSK
ncbi:S41 family peptidase [Sphingobacterium suaedae]|uniref:S41 family peptidase n=1 Tax=Sphingobacterium suaedae TaxID=1686402 RepID=A0ABW5KEX7_9SPHI